MIGGKTDDLIDNLYSYIILEYENQLFCIGVNLKSMHNPASLLYVIQKKWRPISF